MHCVSWPCSPVTWVLVHSLPTRAWGYVFSLGSWALPLVIVDSQISVKLFFFFFKIEDALCNVNLFMCYKDPICSLDYCSRPGEVTQLLGEWSDHGGLDMSQVFNSFLRFI